MKTFKIVPLFTLPDSSFRASGEAFVFNGHFSIMKSFIKAFRQYMLMGLTSSKQPTLFYLDEKYHVTCIFKHSTITVFGGEIIL